jgi:polyisoprenoid-binding protein YceI
MLSWRLLLIVGVLVGGTFLSVNHQALLRAEPAAPPAAYQVDTSASRVFIKVGSATRFGHLHGVEGQLKSGDLRFGGNGGELVFDMGTFTADTAESHKRLGLEHEKISASDAKKVTESMRGPDVLDVGRFPTATFQITAVTALDHQAVGAPGAYQIDGKFTLHGTAQKLQFKARLEPGQRPESNKLSGSFTIKQSDYGIKPYSMFGGVVKVSDELEITGDLLLKASRP